MSPDPSAPTAPANAAAKQPNPATLAFRGLGQAAKAAGLQPQFAGIARMVKDARGRLPSVVVVGEMNRGKSTIVNALLAAPGLAPTGPQELTGLSVAYVPASEEFPLGAAELEYGPEMPRRRIAAAELAQWVRLDSPVLLSADPPPTQALLAVRPAFIQRCSIVDTPGSGGLSEAFALRALSRARDASVLLVVTDAGGRITAPALDFLVKCSSQVQSVVIAVTKIDMYRNSWEQIVAENRAIIAQREPRLADVPIVGVSGAWGERAAAEPDPTKRKRLFEASRIPELAAALRAPLERANQLPTLNALRQGIGLLQPLLTRMRTEHAALGGVVVKQDELIEVRKHREELMRKFEDSRYDWNAQVDRVRIDLTAANSRLVREFGAHWKQRVQSKGSGIGAKEAMVLQQELAADVEVNVHRAMAGIAERSGQLLVELYSAAGMDPHRSLLGEVERRAHEVGQSPRAPLEYQTASLDPRTLLSGALMGSGIGSLALGALLGPVGAALIGMSVMGSLGAVLARRQAKRQSLLQTVGDATVELREVLDRAVRNVLQVVSTDAKKVFDRDLKQSANEAKAELQRLESAKRASESERAQRIKHLEPRIALLAKAIEDAEREVQRLGSQEVGRTS